MYLQVYGPPQSIFFGSPRSVSVLSAYVKVSDLSTSRRSDNMLTTSMSERLET